MSYRSSPPPLALLKHLVALGGCLLIVHLSGPGLAWGEQPDDETNRPAPVPGFRRLLSWEGSATAAYSVSGEFHGWGFGAGLYWFPFRYFGVGSDLESARIQASGAHSQLGSPNDAPYSHVLRSTFWGVSLKGRLPVWRLTAFVALDLGYAWVSTVRAVNTQCEFHSGRIAASTVGMDVSLGKGVALGLGWRFRSHSTSETCTDIGGLAQFPLDPMHQLVLSASFRTSP